VALVFLAGLLVGPVWAQHGRDPAPAPLSSSPSGTDPTARSPTEQQLLQELRKLEGRISIPDYKAAILEQPQGRSYQQFHERILPWVSGIIIVGVLLALAAFYLLRGRVVLRAGAETGIKVMRFNAAERLVHWLTATAFIVLALTGLNYFFGKRLLFPLIGPDAFTAWSQWAKFAHNAMAWPFMLGIALMLLAWVRDNLPDRYDARWLREMGGLMSGRAPPARRFNAGQKLTFWSVILLGLVMAATGITMLFPFWALDINGMQWAQYVHAFAGVILIAIILGHIYIGTIGIVGAFDAMGRGEMDLAEARAQHSVWVEETQAGRSARAHAPAGAPAE
jgi:formate dehydrogenase subunit gamma